jgi:V/A-type H+-transporting ATPase subunit D
VSRAAATRQTLLALRARRARVERGAALLRRRREALVTELFRLARPAVAARDAIARAARDAWPPLLDALASEGSLALRAVGWPARTVAADVAARQVWGVAVAELVETPVIARTPAERGLPLETATQAEREVAERFETLAALLVEAAPREALLRRLGDALARTSRQVRSLEHRVAPELATREAAVAAALEEREREEHLRLLVLAAARVVPGDQPASGSIRPRS